jgi:hypothetical protein
MRMSELGNLHCGDEVYWEDPDDGKCSRFLVILSIYYCGNVVTITEPDGTVVECFARELK